MDFLKPGDVYCGLSVSEGWDQLLSHIDGRRKTCISEVFAVCMNRKCSPSVAKGCSLEPDSAGVSLVTVALVRRLENGGSWSLEVNRQINTTANL